VADDFGIFLFAQPGVVVGAQVAVVRALDRAAGRYWRFGRAARWGGANRDGVFRKVLEFHFL
jgi:hypothetical protein